MTSYRIIGSTQRSLAAIGLGCMGLSEFYGPPTENSAAVKLRHKAISLGVEHFDTAEMYGMGANETLLGDAFHDRRDKVFIATKFGPMRDPETGVPTGIDGSRASCRRAVCKKLLPIPARLEVGATLVAYSPLGRGMLSGRFKEGAALAAGDFRGMTPRYQGDAYQANLALVDEIETIAAKYTCHSAQVALAWVLGRGEHIVCHPRYVKT